MKISSRFAEYGLTGGFFWMCHLLVAYALGLRFPALAGLSTAAATWAAHAPQAATTVVTTLLAALAIIGVFVTGVLLDLAASILFIVENKVFRWHVERDQEWLLPFFRRYSPYCADDLAEFLRLKPPPNFISAVLPPLSNAYRKALASSRAISIWVVAPHAARLWTFLTSYVLFRSASAQHTLFSDQIYLWRSARSLSVTLLIIYFEASIAPAYIVRLHPQIGGLFVSLFGLIAGAILLVCLGFIITGATYSRACDTLLAAVFVTSASADAPPVPIAAKPASLAAQDGDEES